MKIAHLISSSGFFGAENVVISLAESFYNAGDEVYVGTIHNKHNPHTELIDISQSRGLMTYSVESRSKFDFRTIDALKKFLKAKDIDVLHTHCYKSSLIGLLAVKQLRIPIMATAHGYTDVTHKVSLYEKLDRFILRYFIDCVVVVADKVLGGVIKGRKRIIPNGLNIERFQKDDELRAQQRKRYLIEDHHRVVGCVGRLSKEKNQMLLLKAVTALIEVDERIRVLLVGDGPEKNTLVDYCETAGISKKVIWTGLLDDVASIYQAMDVFVLSSLTEGVPLTLLEAMASQVPVVATNVGGIPEIINDNVDGLLVTSDDVEDLSTKIDDALKDQEKTEIRVNAAYVKVANQFSLAKMSERYRQGYQELLGAG